MKIKALIYNKLSDTKDKPVFFFHFDSGRSYVAWKRIVVSQVWIGQWYWTSPYFMVTARGDDRQASRRL
jgi:hypothetical protein